MDGEAGIDGEPAATPSLVVAAWRPLPPTRSQRPETNVLALPMHLRMCQRPSTRRLRSGGRKRGEGGRATVVSGDMAGGK